VTQLSYRPDIDGLRAVAVMSVVLYHFGIVGALSGGFVGVDIFFVISGFLITGLIVADLKVGSFNLLAFYQRRIRRIFPAMLVVLAVSLVAGYFFLLPGDYTSLGVSAAYSAASLSNRYFLQNTGYFDRVADMLPLLHMWSLSVEEQFYLVWPLLLAAFFFIARKEAVIIAALICAVVIGGLWLSVQRTGTDPKSAFFLAHLRAWELALGALLVFLPPLRKSVSRWKNELPTIIGVALIAISVLTLSREHLWTERGPRVRRRRLDHLAARRRDPRRSHAVHSGDAVHWPDFLFAISLALAGARVLPPLHLGRRAYFGGSHGLGRSIDRLGISLVALHRATRPPGHGQAAPNRGRRPGRRIDRRGCRAQRRRAARISGQTVAGRPRHEQPGGNVEVGVSAAGDA
jgi:Acyltransferase family